MLAIATGAQNANWRHTGNLMAYGGGGYFPGLGNNYQGSTGFTFLSNVLYKIHTYAYANSDPFTVDTTTGTPSVDYLVVGGGGSGGYTGGGGGGGGAVLQGTITVASATVYPVTVGLGGPPTIYQSPYNVATGNNGGNRSVFSTVAIGGGGGGGFGYLTLSGNGLPGGSGGGAWGAVAYGTPSSGGVGTHPGQDGGDCNRPSPATTNTDGGGGGGWDGAGQDSFGAVSPGAGGIGHTVNFNGISTVFGSGGGGGGASGNANVSFALGGTNGGNGAGWVGYPSTTYVPATPGVKNTGGGGGAGGAQTASPPNPTNYYENSAAGGDGVVMIRYPV